MNGKSLMILRDSWLFVESRSIGVNVLNGLSCVCGLESPRKLVKLFVMIIVMTTMHMRQSRACFGSVKRYKQIKERKV